MLTTELVEQLKPRMQRLGLVDPQTGFYDQDEILVYITLSMTYLRNRYQLQHFLEIDRQFLMTAPNVESYTIPPSYGFWAPEETRRSGLAIADSSGNQVSNLEYYDPARYNLLQPSGTTGRPAWFTLMNSMIYLQPIPDSVYTIEAIHRPLQAGTDIPDEYSAAVGIETLWRMASDVGKATPLLAEERTQILRTTVNNEMRLRQRFYSTYERVGFNRGRRRSGGY